MMRVSARSVFVASIVLGIVGGFRGAGELRADDDARKAPAEASTEAKAKVQPKPEPGSIALLGGTVHVDGGRPLDGATVVCKAGKIVAIGHHAPIPDTATRMDVSGYQIYPGLIGVNTRGLVAGPDGTDAFGLSMTLALAAGMTTVANGSNTYKLTYGTLDGLTLSSACFVSLTYVSNDPTSRRKLFDRFERVRTYIRDLDFYERNKDSQPKPEKPSDRFLNGEYKQAFDLMKGSGQALVSANTTRELLEMAHFAERFGVRLVIYGCREGYLVAGDLARAGVRAIVTPRTRADHDERYLRPNGASIENARILWEHGVPVAITPASTGISSWGGFAGRDLQHLSMEAAFAVRGGLPESAAIDAVTIGAARLLGVDTRVGSIEIGKDADFAITDGDLLHYMTHVHWTIVNGRVAYAKQKDSLFDHIRPPKGDDTPPPSDPWPRSLGEDW